MFLKQGKQWAVLLEQSQSHYLVHDSNDRVVFLERSEIDNNDIFTLDKKQMDARDKEILALARAKYPTASSDLMALLKWFSRSTDHGRTTDEKQDKRMREIEDRLSKIEAKLDKK